MCIVPIIFGVILYKQLPEQMAVHFGLNNEPNSFAPDVYKRQSIEYVKKLDLFNNSNKDIKTKKLNKVA